MASVLKRDSVFENIPSIKTKTLRINLNPDIYGTFAEIGAGQETARHFFRSGGASGTIAKAMSAYDKDFSDAIYGVESDGRYVTQARLKTMLDYEMQLMEERISRENHPDRLFFSYANTVATIDFSKRYKGHGWVGIRYQLDPKQKEFDEIINIKVRSTGRLLRAKINFIKDKAKVKILDKETGISPGQACVFYSKDEFGDKVLGGGWIDKTYNNNLST